MPAAFAVEKPTSWRGQLGPLDVLGVPAGTKGYAELVTRLIAGLRHLLDQAEGA